MAKQMINQIAQETDVANLQMALTQMQGGLTQAPEQFRPALEVVIQKINERLAELEAGKEE
jgi:hypothetical protein